MATSPYLYNTSIFTLIMTMTKKIKSKKWLGWNWKIISMQSLMISVFGTKTSRSQYIQRTDYFNKATLKIFSLILTLDAISQSMSRLDIWAIISRLNYSTWTSHTNNVINLDNWWKIWPWLGSNSLLIQIIL